MKRLYTIIITGLALFSFSQTNAQPYLNFYFNGSCPMDALKDSGYKHGLGFSIEFLSADLIKSKANRIELRLGMGFEFLHYRSSKPVKDLVFNTPDNDLGSVKFNNQMGGFYIGPKFIVNMGKISPYIDVFAATRTFSSHQVNTFNKEVPGYDRNTDYRLAWYRRPHYGASLGLMYNLGKSAVFDLRVSYSMGGDMKFIDLNSPERHPDYESNIKYRYIHSPVSNILIYRVGIMLRLGRCKDCPRRSSTPGQRSVSTPAPTPAPTSKPKPTSTPKKKPAELKPVPKQPEPPKPVEN